MQMQYPPALGPDLYLKGSHEVQWKADGPVHVKHEKSQIGHLEFIPSS